MATKAPFGVYSWNNVALVIDSRNVVGLAEGDDVLTIERTNALGDPMVGADGSSLVSVSADQTAKITLKLLPTSPFNAYLNAKAMRMRAGGRVVFPIGFTDMSTGESGASAECTIIEEPTVTKGAKAQERVWAFHAAEWVPSDIEINRT